MQTTVSRSALRCTAPNARRSAARPPAFGSTTSRRTSVQVLAKGKGKGKSAMRGSMPGQMQEMRREPPTPEVDPENAEFVIFFRCLKYKEPQLNTMVGPSLWVPLSVVKGNNVSNFLVNAIKSEWGMKLYGRTLVWQMASGLYLDKDKVEKELRKNFPPFANVPSKDFEYAFKIRDKENPKDWTKTEDLTVFPQPEQLGATGLEALKSFFAIDNLAGMFKAPESSAPSQQ